ncbi:LacI family DNA-binding transcriptional regulator [Jeotgalibacillus proteolyticus]|uniref:Catabolite control protein A n=1 Tax=Jeotgalibacillus proteolyticus TaxID=2082395 RepID=A0A2S5G8W0_9BACL|nr:LacI family DNA-binding transcriptional regulator [Jeotgalibacillus proteolyticus]PPA69354.1 transcriptional regulator [Jeotgalibacillus proteolyticus]
MATIKEVAKKAGVSVATVSRVINNKGYVHEDTRKAVDQAIKDLGYKPNSVARSLYKKTSKTIGFLIPDITNPFFPQLVRAVEDVMYPAGYTTILFNSDENLAHELEYIEKMTSKYIDGFIVVSNTLQWEHLQDVNVPIVALDRHIDQRISSITVDNYDGAKKAIEYMLDRGCKQIAHLEGPENVLTSMERKRAYEDMMNQHGLPILCHQGHYELARGMVSTMQLLSNNPKIDGLFAANDVMAIGALKAATKLGIQVPKQLSIMGFDGVEWGTTVTPELTTMEQPIYEMGKRAAELLLMQIQDSPNKIEHHLLKTSLKVRQSVQ